MITALCRTQFLQSPVRLTFLLLQQIHIHNLTFVASCLLYHPGLQMWRTEKSHRVTILSPGLSSTKCNALRTKTKSSATTKNLLSVLQGRLWNRSSNSIVAGSLLLHLPRRCWTPSGRRRCWGWWRPPSPCPSPRGTPRRRGCWGAPGTPHLLHV